MQLQRVLASIQNIPDDNAQVATKQLNGCSPFIHYDGMPGFGVKLRRCRDEARLDEELLLMADFSRHLNIDDLASHIDVRLRCTCP